MATAAGRSSATARASSATAPARARSESCVEVLPRQRRAGADPVRVLQRELEPAQRRGRRADEAVPRRAGAPKWTNCTGSARGCASSANAPFRAGDPGPHAGRGSLTAGNARLQLSIAASYGNRQVIAQPHARWPGGRRRPPARRPDRRKRDLRAGVAGRPAPPDLFIRTGGELRISNFPLLAAGLHRAVVHRTRCARTSMPPHCAAHWTITPVANATSG